MMDVVVVAATLFGAAVFGLFSTGGDYRLVLAVAVAIAALGGVTMLVGNLERVFRPKLIASDRASAER
ncbi:MAG TPA: hypothetical protein VL147_12615 [Devosia sp.]|nr:hypothetical protein [Devosia sp.]